MKEHKLPKYYEDMRELGREEREKEILEIIDEKIRIRKVSENREVSKYETIFSINDLKELKQKIKEKK